MQHPQPVVLFLDEADSIAEGPMASFLAQLRGGFALRPWAFPSSIVLVGLRDLRDYLVQAKDGVPPNPGSPFNVTSHSLTLRDFTEAEVAALYAQHTAETGQSFLPEAVARAFYWTRGQPFLVIVLTHLGSFRGDSAFHTWVWRIAANHLARVRKGRRETVTFEILGERLRTGLREPVLELPDPESDALAHELHGSHADQLGSRAADCLRVRRHLSVVDGRGRRGVGDRARRVSKTAVPGTPTPVRLREELVWRV